MSNTNVIKINRMNDNLVKHIFAKQERSHIIVNVINSIFTEFSLPLIKKVKLIQNELAGEGNGLMGSRLDILAEADDDTRINIEFQIGEQAYFIPRILKYWARVYAPVPKGSGIHEIQLKDGKFVLEKRGDAALVKTVCISFLKHSIFKEFPDEPLTMGAISNVRHPSSRITDMCQLFFVELDKFVKIYSDENEITDFSIWCLYFSNLATNKKLKDLAAQNSALAEVLTVEEVYMNTPELLAGYKSAEERIDDINNMILAGRMDERNTMLFRLLQKNIPMEVIVDVTSFDPPYIKAFAHDKGLYVNM